MESMFLIAGLGNPGSDYARTRHNAGFLAVESFARYCGGVWSLDGRFESRLARVSVGGCKVWLCQPQTYMNDSGRAVSKLSAFYRVQMDRVLVVADDADLPCGTLRMRPGGSSGGHHGLESVEQYLGRRDYPRLRIGIGRLSEPLRQITNYVLGRFRDDEQEILEKVLDRSNALMQCWVECGIDKAMSQFNGIVKTPKTESN